MTLHKTMAIVLAFALLLGCAQQQDVSETTVAFAPVGDALLSVPETEPASDLEAAAASRPVTLLMPQTVYIYRYFMEEQIYEKQPTTYTGELTLLAVVKHIAKACNIEDPLPVISAYTNRNGGDTIDFKQALIEQLDKRALYTFLSTLVTTLQQNRISSGPVYIRIDGDITMFEGYRPAILNLVYEGNPAEFAAICASIPYEGLRKVSLPSYPATIKTPSDVTTREIAEFLSLLGYIDVNAASPAELDQQALTVSCILATNFYFSIPKEEFYAPYYRKELMPISDAIEAKLGGQEDMFWIAEHVQKTAKLLYGQDYILQLTQQNCRPWWYFEAEGVIAPSHRDGGGALLPVILSCKNQGDSYHIEAVYVIEGIDGYYIVDDTALLESELADVVYNRATRREIILKRAEDGNLRFVSHRFL